MVFGEHSILEFLFLDLVLGPFALLQEIDILGK